ncbi:MAG: hypothetical protein EOP50_05740 [Sphingobacteriales bacterium]|nr:MAG: hypothetical protein EOP50_05740 [Sphingobacteriales bacterium]
MSDKVLYSVSSLKNWSDKILSDTGRRERRLESFMLDFNIPDYWRFYLELQPFLEERAALDPERYRSFVRTYQGNKVLLEEAMKENALARMVGSLLGGYKPMARTAADLVAAIREVKLNTENLEMTMSVDL